MAIQLLKTPETEQWAPCVLSKQDVVNMICGRPMPPVRVCEQMMAAGYMDLEENSEEQKFIWRRDAMLTQPIEALLVVYLKLKKLDKPLIGMVG